MLPLVWKKHLWGCYFFSRSKLLKTNKLLFQYKLKWANQQYIFAQIQTFQWNLKLGFCTVWFRRRNLPTTANVSCISKFLDKNTTRKCKMVAGGCWLQLLQDKNSHSSSHSSTPVKNQIREQTNNLKIIFWPFKKGMERLQMTQLHRLAWNTDWQHSLDRHPGTFTQEHECQNFTANVSFLEKLECPSLTWWRQMLNCLCVSSAGRQTQCGKNIALLATVAMVKRLRFSLLSRMALDSARRFPSLHRWNGSSPRVWQPIRFA